jgi:hypothetical protein
MMFQSMFKATFMYTNPFLILSPLEVNYLERLAINEVLRVRY